MTDSGEPGEEDDRLFLLMLRSPVERWDELPDEEGDAETAAHANLIEELEESGRLVYCSPLDHPGEGSEVLIRDGVVEVEPETITEEPFAGFYIVRCRSRVEAVAIAARIPDAANSPVLVRPLMDVAAVEGTLAGTAPRS